MKKLSFKKKVIAQVNNRVSPSPGEMNTFSMAGDINNDGWIDYVVSGRNGKMVWLENKGEDKEWEEHLIDEVAHMECGGSLVDITGSGFMDIINGGDWQDDRVYWWENPGKTGVKWKKREIIKTGAGQIHDTIIGDVTSDGTRALIFSNQLAKGGTTIYYIPIPKGPSAGHWPGARVVAAGKTEVNPHRDDGVQPEEGLAIGDVDNDGKNELICGCHWYKYNGKEWVGHKFASGYITCKCVVGDIDGDGRNEIILSEGDPCVYGKRQGGKAAWFKPGEDITGMWEEHIIEDFLFDAHTLQVGNICGNGKCDILIGEVGKSDENRKYVERLPRIMVFENDGNGNFERHIIDQGTGIHEGQLVDITKKGILDIIGKPLQDSEMWNIHVYFNSL